METPRKAAYNPFSQSNLTKSETQNQQPDAQEHKGDGKEWGKTLKQRGSNVQQRIETAAKRRLWVGWAEGIWDLSPQG